MMINHKLKFNIFSCYIHLCKHLKSIPINKRIFFVSDAFFSSTGEIKQEILHGSHNFHLTLFLSLRENKRNRWSTKPDTAGRKRIISCQMSKRERLFFSWMKCDVCLLAVKSRITVIELLLFWERSSNI